MSLSEGQSVPRFKVDENLPVEAAEALRLAGYDALTVLDQSMGGALDGPLAGRLWIVDEHKIRIRV